MTADKCNMRLACLVLALVLAACSARYGSIGLMGGVDSTPLTGDTEMVVARGNGFTDPAKVQEFVLLKASEDCLARGYDRFGILSAQDDSRHGAIVLPGHSYSTSTVTGFGNMATVNTNTYSTPASVLPVFKPGQTVIVKFFRANDPEAKNLLDAHQIAANLGPRLER